MLDLSPEKVMMLMAVGLVVLGPNKLPAAARGLALGLARARRLAGTLTDPITTNLFDPVRANLAEFTEPLKAGLAEPGQALGDAVADLRSVIAAHPVTPTADGSAIPVDPSLN